MLIVDNIGLAVTASQTRQLIIDRETCPVVHSRLRARLVVLKEGRSAEA